MLTNHLVSTQKLEKVSGPVSYFFSQLLTVTIPVYEKKKKAQLPPNQSPKRKLNKKEIQVEFKHKIIQLFSAIEEIFHNDITISWTNIFYYRMLIKRDILTKEQTSNMKEIVQSFISMVKKEENTYPFLGHCYSFVEYLEFHKIDPDNSLIGLKVHSSLLSKYNESFFTTSTPNNNLEVAPNINLLGNQYSISVGTVQLTFSASFSGTSSTSNNNNNNNNINSKIQKEDKKKTVVKQNTPKRITQKAKSLLDLSGNTLYSKGEIVIFVDQAKTRGIFARVADNSDHSHIQIYIDPFEMNKKKTNLNLIYSLSEDVIENNFNNPVNMLKLIHDPIESWIQETSTQILQKTKQLLEENNIPSFTMENFKELIGVPFHPSHICHLTDLTKLQNLLLDWKSNPPEEFFNSIDELALSSYQSFIENHNLQDCFEVTKIRSLTQASSTKYRLIAKDILRTYLGNCESIVLQIEDELQSILDGTTKQKLSSWWLSKIYQAVKDFLESLGYQSSAIPDDYIANPPSNIQPIRNNLQIVTEVLNTKDDIHHVREFLSKLTSEIYERIDEFILSAHYAISPYIELPRPFPPPLSLEELGELIIRVEGTEEAVIEENVLGLIKDLEYLMEMKDMDENSDNNTGGTSPLVLSKVVPVKGLIMGSFFRKENVLRTILELFDHTPVDASPIIQDIVNNSIPNDDVDFDKILQLRASYNDKLVFAVNSFDWDATIRLATELKQKESDLAIGLPHPSKSKLKRASIFIKQNTL